MLCQLSTVLFAKSGFLSFKLLPSQSGLRFSCQIKTCSYKSILNGRSGTSSMPLTPLPISRILELSNLIMSTYRYARSSGIVLRSEFMRDDWGKLRGQGGCNSNDQVWESYFHDGLFGVENWVERWRVPVDWVEILRNCHGKQRP